MRKRSKTTIRNTLLVSLGVEASLSALGLWSVLAHVWGAWRPAAWLLVGALLGVLLVRTLRAISLLAAEPHTLRRASIGAAVSLLGWVAMVAIFALINLKPELAISPLWLVPAFLCHVGGALLALHELR